MLTTFAVRQEKRRYSNRQYHVAALAEAPKLPNPSHYQLDPESSVWVAYASSLSICRPTGPIYRITARFERKPEKSENPHPSSLRRGLFCL